MKAKTIIALAWMIMFSGTSGDWVITFVLLNGDVYEGEFVL